MVFVRLVFGVWRAILAGPESRRGATGLFGLSSPIGRNVGEVENL